MTAWEDQAQIKFPCSRCGACCRLAFLVPESVRGDVVIPNEKGVCIHLRKDNTCDIYESRPKMCKVDAMRPPDVPPMEWYSKSLKACNTLHLGVYSTPRIPIVAE
jgi:hypothetical protein